MSNQDSYITLVSSLPISERLFIAKQPPLSRPRLDRRLKSLTIEDSNTLMMIEDLLTWSSYPMTSTDADVIERIHDVLEQVRQPTLIAIIRQRMELRSLISALRLRQQGETAPTTPFGYSRWQQRIHNNWTEPSFGLETIFPWLAKAQDFLSKQDPLGLERFILDITFRQLQRHASNHLFDFEAVVIYVLKWNIFDRWAHSNTEAAVRRFETLTEDALGDFSGFDYAGL